MVSSTVNLKSCAHCWYSNIIINISFSESLCILCPFISVCDNSHNVRIFYIERLPICT